MPHVAFKVDDLAAAIEGEEVILGPYEPIDDYRVAVINDAGVPIELIQTDLDDETLWARAKSRQGSIYR
ncbi:VOC family protein [Aeromonas jandaei]|uniref:VOC family protein n=1 Tax=Aeromonas jandaei TaxID=650 RepID=UPI0039889991